ncbi:MAG: hypothetical protein HEQ29_01885 [Dolichospermum sp. LBC05a]|jgi:hypothetical protein|uniref:hypothetical protein n=1 Tax=Anabaena sp. AL09 TaxID=1710891 RepID=UPI0007FC2D92|nr:hypothetical protein [Anabaena sp. AL09]MBS9391957.1 hypothetical protein [Dolichospermum sp. OL01]MCO5795602.1 hypothetical protein [Dolichospermum sp. OL03]OBQ12333.1 MAG: hypothetical protein AN490_04490 [Anabaena sp. AL09]QSV57295.1 MAG: hypothetical protein HEQ29_01885 [Dolichospermum sp. LBC05a]
MSLNNNLSNNDDYNDWIAEDSRIKEERNKCSLKSVSTSQLEETISKALSELLNYPYKVKIEYINFADADVPIYKTRDDGSELKLIVYQEKKKVEE